MADEAATTTETTGEQGTGEAPPTSGSLLDAGGTDAGPGTQPAEPAGKKAAKAVAAAAGERPEWCPEKFWDAEKKAPHAEKLAQSYAQLESRFGAFKGAPKAGEDGKVKYAFKIPDGYQGTIDEDSQEWAAVQELAARQNMSEDALHEWVDLQVTMFGRATQQAQDQQMTVLREAGFTGETLAAEAKWWQEYLDTDEQFESLKEITGIGVTPAAVIQFLSGLRGRISARTIPSKVEGQQPTGKVTMETLQEHLRHEPDQRNQAEWNDWLARRQHLSKVLAGEA